MIEFRDSLDELARTLYITNLVNTYLLTKKYRKVKNYSEWLKLGFLEDKVWLKARGDWRNIARMFFKKRDKND